MARERLEQFAAWSTPIVRSLSAVYMDVAFAVCERQAPSARKQCELRAAIGAFCEIGIPAWTDEALRPARRAPELDGDHGAFIICPYGVDCQYYIDRPVADTLRFLGEAPDEHRKAAWSANVFYRDRGGDAA